ncbi:MAG: winged helix-turn-helix transcriptional regulator [Anaerolineaceae bacterium]|nr:winged helix-turn-helix transcriptional regulator [Anaerolineaceae bacterium]
MSSKQDPHCSNETLARRFMIAIFALRGHIAAHSVIEDAHGMNTSQIKMLHLIFHRPGISQTAVAERLGVTTASISASVRALEAQALIERHRDSQDARVMLLYLAPLGEQLFDRIWGTFIDTFADLLNALPLEEQAQLVERFEALLSASHISIDNSTLCYIDKLQTVKE